MTDLDRLLARVRRQWMALKGLEGAARALAACALVIAAVALFDRWGRPQGSVLAVAWAGALAACAALVAATAWRLRRAPSDRQIARFVEERFPALDDAVVSAVELRARASSSADPFAPLVIASASARLQHIDVADAVPFGERRRAAWRAGAAAAACVLAVLFARPALGRALDARSTSRPARSPADRTPRINPPRVVRVDLHYDFPSFTGLKPRDEPDGGDAYGPVGTRVQVLVHTDKPIASGRLAFSDRNGADPLTKIDDKTWRSSLTIDGDAAYRVTVADATGRASDSIEYFVRVMDDRPPDVHILRPAGDEPITPLQEVPIEARADDDYGIASFDMVYSVAGGPERIVPFTTVRGTEQARVGSRLLAAEDLHVKPGDVIAYYARATDVARGKRSTLSRSEIFFLEVTPFNEEYALAQSQAMAAATGTEIEGLIAAQKEIIGATWNLERRSAAGRSAEDVRHVADAQAELKGRTQEAARNSSSSGDPVSAAIEAMGRAVKALEALNTGEAIPHEMASLNALLQAAADVRRRQVSQSQNGNGSYGGGRQGQDLSNLFDRELKRQSKTAYETKSPVETTPEQKGESALDRIRDLARRQEQLAEDERGLSGSNASQDEKQRRLEKLKREEEELRRQLEREVRNGGSGGSAGSGGADRSGSRGSSGSDGSIRDAMERMRESAQQLQRNDPQGAAASAQRAADQLRQAERRMQPGASGGAAADQLERIRAARERLAGLEKEITDGVAQGKDPSRSRQQYDEELQRVRGMMNGLSTPERHEWSHSAPGTEAFKQDYAAWQSLAKDVSRALERYEANVAGRLSGHASPDRLRAGGSERVPDAYDKRVSKYFESIAKKGSR